MGVALWGMAGRLASRTPVEIQNLTVSPTQQSHDGTSLAQWMSAILSKLDSRVYGAEVSPRAASERMHIDVFRQGCMFSSSLWHSFPKPQNPCLLLSFLCISSEACVLSNVCTIITKASTGVA